MANNDDTKQELKTVFRAMASLPKEAVKDFIQNLNDHDRNLLQEKARLVLNIMEKTPRVENDKVAEMRNPPAVNDNSTPARKGPANS